MKKTLFHISGWSRLARMEQGDVFTLTPGVQCAEGVGVYFSEGTPRSSAAEGARNGRTAVVKITTTAANGWWRSKNSVVRKFNRPRTWHTNGKGIQCQVLRRDGDILTCRWRWAV